MEERCPNCNAMLKYYSNQNMTSTVYCEYCGYERVKAPESGKDLAFSLVNKALFGLGITSDENFLPTSNAAPSKRKLSDIEQCELDLQKALQDGDTRYAKVCRKRLEMARKREAAIERARRR